MKECLVDVLDARGTVLHVFPIPVENQDGTPKTMDPEREALKLAALVHLVPETEAEGLHARPHVCRGGPLQPYGDVLETRHPTRERTEQRIRERAYFLWRQEGCLENRAEEHWHQARELEATTDRSRGHLQTSGGQRPRQHSDTEPLYSGAARDQHRHRRLAHVATGECNRLPR